MRVRSRSLLASGAVVALAASGVLVQGGAAFATGAPVTSWATLVSAFAAGGTVTLGGDITQVSGDARLITPVGKPVTLDLNGHKLTAAASPTYYAGVEVPLGASLTIEDIAGGGSLSATGTTNAAGIGGDSVANAGSVTINSGTVTATGGSSAAGIGDASGGTGATVTINGGTVTATGGQYGAGIGGSHQTYGSGKTSGAVTINGGTVTATGGSTGAGIGGGTDEANSSVTIADGTVIATGGDYGAGIGGGEFGNGGTVTISGGTVTARSSSYGAGIGGGYRGSNSGGDGAAVTISGGNVTASSGTAGLAVGGGSGASAFGSLDVEGGMLTIPAGASLTVPTGSTVTVAGEGKIQNMNLITNQGTISGTGTVANLGTILNSGTLSVDKVTGHNYSLSFDPNGGSLTGSSILQVYAATVSAAQESLPDVSRDGYTFNGWSTADDQTVGASTNLEDLFNGSDDGAAIPVGLTADWTADETVPGAPTGVTAVAGNGQATVSWTAPADDGGSPITSYTVTAGALTKTCASSPCTVTGLTNGNAYVFTVHATNAVGDSVESPNSNLVTPATKPGAPTDVSAVRGNGSASVSWTAPASDGGSPITGYTVTTFGATQSCASSPCTVTGLTNGNSYTFRVVATNAVGDSVESASSDAVIPATVPGAPRDVSAVRGNGNATVSWTAPAGNGGTEITGYTVTSSPGDKTATCASSPCVVEGLTNGTAYTFTVVATNDVGDSVASDPSAAVTPAAVPDAPTGVSAVAGDGQATASWTAPESSGGSAVTGYTVTAHPGGATATAGASATSATVTGLTNGTSYTFTVRATNEVGDSIESAASAAVTPSAPAKAGQPGAPATTGQSWYADPLSKAKRHHLVAAHPGREGGKVRQTKAAFRSHDGTLLVSAAKAHGHQLGKGQGVQLTGLFRFDSATLTKAGRHKLAKLAKSMKDAKAFTCEGYADYGGAAGHEQSLSQRRAQAVCVVLTRKLGKPLHAKVVGFGSTRPVAVGGSAQSRTDNRRVDLLVRR